MAAMLNILLVTVSALAMLLIGPLRTAFYVRGGVSLMIMDDDVKLA